MFTSGATLNLGSNINFSTNSSTLYGGAIYNNGDLNIEDNGYYYNNLAQVGGALLNFESGIINVSSSNYFENNRATNGEGGAIENVGTLSISSGTKFVLNEANTNGGAISNAMYINGDFVANANIGDYVLFSSNTANYGGGLSNISAIAIIGNNNIFEYNMASSEGGAIYNTKNDYKDVVGQITISSNTKFLNNTATNLGVAIFNNSGIITIYSTASFTNNSSDLGGAIYNSEGMINIGTDSSFKSNYTTTNGGAIFNQSNGIINVIRMLNLVIMKQNMPEELFIIMMAR
jgi:predicted outer membrane repeat protein